MIFDFHADILYDVASKINQDERRRCWEYHKERMLRQQIKGVALECWYENTSHDLPLAMVFTAMDEIKRDSDVCVIGVSPVEHEERPLHVLFALEGLSALGSASEITRLYHHGIRMASLTWNEENMFATGAKGNALRGLTTEGVELVWRMQELPMIIDLSHANSITAFDILAHTHGGVMATHSNAAMLCPHRRNLTDPIAMEIARQGGIVCCTPVKQFVSNKQKVTIQDYIKQLAYFVNLIGIRSVGLGFDFMDYLPDAAIMCDSLESIDDLSNLTAAMLRQFTPVEVERLTYQNAFDFLKRYLS